ncbi:MAG: gamma-glutamyl-gamma-aminobutyrate hydrolase family protein [Candidatus Zixiibacteriota bacterium]
MKKPIIGITCYLDYDDPKRKYPFVFAFDYVKRQYYLAIQDAGGVPIILPNIEKMNLVDYYVKTLDGLLLGGGGDVHPSFFHERIKAKNLSIKIERDRFEIALAKKALRKKLPILGICRGPQVINIVLGGTIFQDLSLRKEKTLNHQPEKVIRFKRKHKVKIKENSRLYSVVKQKEILVNTSHHQVIKDVAPGLKASAWSEDGVIEALEGKTKDFLISVQWHPEAMIKHPSSRALFKAFVKECRKR